MESGFRIPALQPQSSKNEETDETGPHERHERGPDDGRKFRACHPAIQGRNGGINVRGQAHRLESHGFQRPIREHSTIEYYG